MADDEDGKQFEVTRKRIKEIEKRALEKIKKEKQASKRILKCNFCGKEKNSVKKLIQSDSGATICNECVQMCYEIIDKDVD